MYSIIIDLLNFEYGYMKDRNVLIKMYVNLVKNTIRANKRLSQLARECKEGQNGKLHVRVPMDNDLLSMCCLLLQCGSYIRSGMINGKTRMGVLTTILMGLHIHYWGHGFAARQVNHSDGPFRVIDNKTVFGEQTHFQKLMGEDFGRIQKRLRLKQSVDYWFPDRSLEDKQFALVERQGKKISRDILDLEEHVKIRRLPDW